MDRDRHHVGILANEHDPAVGDDVDSILGDDIGATGKGQLLEEDRRGPGIGKRLDLEVGDGGHVRGRHGTHPWKVHAHGPSSRKSDQLMVTSGSRM